ncbi:MAG: FAD-binding protein [Eubacteriales bacterium]|nr:FAD-binding protein [Eubacteriales bacterium]
MSILVTNIRLPLEASEQEAYEAAWKKCGLHADDMRNSHIYRASIDARRGRMARVVSVLLELQDKQREQAIVAQLGKNDVRLKKGVAEPVATGTEILAHRPVVVGFGPAGLFAAYALAKNGYRPLVIERGQPIESRDQAVETFFSGGAFDPASNIQFGEGGAGAYSDGKLTSRINDPMGEFVLHTLAAHGAPKEILYQAKPHIGTDILKQVVRSMREEIIRMGGQVRFGCTLTGIVHHNATLQAAVIDGEAVACERLILAIGHSARDTFGLLHAQGVFFEPKPFSVGARIEHLQEEIDCGLYGKFAGHPALPPAEYALSYRSDGRACYSFCMCPGGQIVAAQSEPDSIVTNGMSYHARSGRNANAAIVVSVDPSDFPSSDALAGIAFQRQIERQAFRTTESYRAPCQTVGDFLQGTRSKKHGRVAPTYPIGVQYITLEGILPEFVIRQMRDGLRQFGRKIRGFDAPDALLTGPETRTSSPVRITRLGNRHSRDIVGLIPCGEGAGYAGGIMSAAVDGIGCAQEILQTFRPLAERSD